MATIRDTAHPYYGAEGTGEYGLTEFDTVDELIEHANGYDEDMNFVYRWDWNIPDPRDYEDPEDGPIPPETLTLFVILQRKSRIVNWVAPVTADDEEKVREFLASDRILGALRRTWAPLLDAPTETDINRLAQTFYEASGITLPSMTDKPMIVRGLEAVFARLHNEETP
jgi:hypothetical protein